MKFLRTIYSRGEHFAANIILDPDFLINGKPSLFFFGDCDEDKDGSPDWNQDEYGAPDTSLHFNGKPINGNVVPFFVIPPEIAILMSDKFLGCAAFMEWKGRRVSGVVADAGPRNKLGEASSAALAAVRAPTSRNGTGGIDAQEVLFRIWPGVPAHLVIDGVDYVFDLKSWGGI